MSEPAPTGDEPSTGRQCGRGRNTFPTDATVHATARQERWLHVGDDVLVHDRRDAGLALLPGTVAIIDTAAGPTDVGATR